MIIEILKALLEGIVEGITEWLPISSTGHMILIDEFVKLQVSDQFLALFLVVIQIGAILAVIIMYFHKLNPFSFKKTPAQRKSTWRLWGMIFIVLERRNHRRFQEARAGLALSGPRPRGKHARVDAQAHATSEQLDAHAEEQLFKITDVDDIDWKTALKIGLFQVLAIIPGTSRSGATIIGGMLTGCSRTAAAEFTFFLAIPVMLGWGAVKAAKFVLAGVAMTTTEIAVLVTGVVSAFVMSIISIKFLMGYIKKNDFTAFGIYRIIVGVLVLAYFAFETMGMLP